MKKLVYLAAYLPVSGQSLLALAKTDGGSILGQEINGDFVLIQNANGTLDVRQDQIVNAFIQDGSAEVQNLVLQNLPSGAGYPVYEQGNINSSQFWLRG